MAKQSDSKVPKIRFKGFEAEWTEKRLGTVCAIGDTDHWMPKTNSHGIPYVMTGDFCGINEIDFKKAKKISLADFEKLSKKIKPERGDILFARYASIGAVRYVNFDQDFIASYSCAILKSNNSFDSEYLFFLIQSVKFQNQLKLTINTGSQGNVGIESLKQFTVLFPEKTEQSKIARLFSRVNEMLRLHQRKHDKLVTLKKAMLQKMFPQPGATTPEIRFKGFSGEWKMQTLDQLANRFDNLRIPISASNRIPGKTPYYGANGIQGYVQGHTHDGEYILVAEDGANDVKNYPVQFVSGKVWVNNHAHVLQAKDDLAETRFLKYAFTQINVEVFLVGGGRSKLNAETMMHMKLCAPADIKEQQRISTYFRTLDALISKHAIQLEKLKQLKSACLERMFV